MATERQHRRGTTAQHESFIGANGEVTVDTDLKTARVHDGSTAGGSILQRDMRKAVGNIHNPLTDLDLKSAAGVRASKFAGDFQFLRESDATYIDRYGVLHKTSYYSGTPSATDSFSIDDSTASFGDLTDYVIYVTDGSSEAYRWVDANSSTKVIWDKPIAFTPTSYKISKPRFEEDGMLIEGSSENLLTYSEQFDNAAWTKSNTTVSADAATAPDGTTTADKIVSSATADVTNSVARSLTPTASTSYTQSAFVEAAGYNYALIQFRNFVSSGWKTAIFDLSNGAVTHTTDSSITAAIEPLANGIHRIAATVTTDQAVSSTVHVGLTDSPTTSVITGDGTSGVYAWGAQLEALPFASSYIPTTSAAVTRAADACAIDVDKNAPLIGGPISVVADACPVGHNTSSNQAAFQIRTTDGALQLSAFWWKDGDNTLLPYYDGNQTGVTASIAGARIAMTHDGVETLYVDIDGVNEQEKTVAASSDGAGTVIGVGESGAGGNQLFGHMASLRIWDSELSAAERRVA